MLLSNDSGQLALCPTHRLQPASSVPASSTRDGIMSASSVSASETPLINSGACVEYDEAPVPSAAWVGKVVDMPSPLKGNATIDSVSHKRRGSERYYAARNRLETLQGHLDTPTIKSWHQDEWKRFSQAASGCSPVCHSTKKAAEDKPGNKLYVYIVRWALLPDKGGKPGLHIAIETHLETQKDR